MLHCLIWLSAGNHEVSAKALPSSSHVLMLHCSCCIAWHGSQPSNHEVSAKALVNSQPEPPPHVALHGSQPGNNEVSAKALPASFQPANRRGSNDHQFSQVCVWRANRYRPPDVPPVSSAFAAPGSTSMFQPTDVRYDAPWKEPPLGITGKAVPPPLLWNRRGLLLRR